MRRRSYEFRRTIVVLLAAACETDRCGETLGPVSPIARCRVANMSVTPSTRDVDVGGDVSLSANVTLSGDDPRCRNPAIVGWTSSNPSVAAVQSQGAQQATIVGVAPGTAVINATVTDDQGNKVRSATINVTPLTVGALTLSPNALTVVVGNTGSIGAEVKNPRGEVITSRASIAWSAVPATIATVSSSGVVTGIAVGTATITAIATVTGRPETATSTAAVQVTTPPAVAVSQVTLEGPTTVQGGKTIELTATARAADGTILINRPVSWSTDAPSSAVVSPKVGADRTGVVGGEKVGTATIKAQVEGKEATQVVTVIPGDVAAIAITPPIASLRAGKTVQLTAVASDIKQNVVLNQTFTWTSLAQAATVGTNGLVTAVSQGSTEIRASIGTVNGTAIVGVSNRRIAYGVANQPQSATYPAALAFNANGGPITIASQGSGLYRVRIPGQQRFPGETETILVSRYGEGNSYCKLGGEWGIESGGDLVADVRCFNFVGSAADAAFSIMLLGDEVLFGRFGFAFANQSATTGPYTPANSYNSGPLNPPPVAIARGAIGQYAVSFPGNAGGPNDPEAIHVTAVGTSDTRCNVAEVVQEAVHVRCYAPTNSTPMDSPFTVTLLDRGRGGGLRGGYAWTADATGEEYETPGTYQLTSIRAHNSNLGVVEVTKLADVGRYEVVFRGLAPSTPTGTLGVQVVDRDADEPMFCNVAGWSVVASDVRVTVQCWHSINGEPEDESFYLIVIQ